jgi:hypothetical protein
MRLDKFLANENIGSRKEVGVLIRSGAVTVNGQAVKKADAQIDAEKDEICVNGKPVRYNEFVYLLMNKPSGVLTATRDNRAKTVLDLMIIMVMTCSLGKGCVFFAIPVFLWEGSLTLMARGIRPLMTEAALNNLSLVGSVLIFCVGINLIWGKKIRVANLLPAVALAVAAAFLPFSC